jgi:hypothetical protein
MSKRKVPLAAATRRDLEAERLARLSERQASFGDALAQLDQIAVAIRSRPADAIAALRPSLVSVHTLTEHLGARPSLFTEPRMRGSSRPSTKRSSPPGEKWQAAASGARSRCSFESAVVRGRDSRYPRCSSADGQRHLERGRIRCIWHCPSSRHPAAVPTLKRLFSMNWGA